MLGSPATSSLIKSSTHLDCIVKLSSPYHANHRPIHIQLPVLPAAMVETFYKEPTAVYIQWGEAKEIPPFHSGISKGFDVCNIILIRDRRNRVLMYHYWRLKDPSLSRLNAFADLFDPNTIEIVILGNDRSESLLVIEKVLASKFRRVKRYEVQERELWDVVYDAKKDNLIYSSFEKTIQIDKVFGPRKLLASAPEIE